MSPKARYSLGQCEGLIAAMSETPIRPEHHRQLLEVAMVKGAMATTAIEGNTLTMDEVEQVLAGHDLPSSREYQATEVRNVLEAMNVLLDRVLGGHGWQPVTTELLLEMHRLIGRDLGDHFDAVPGRLRDDARVVGAYRCPRHEDVPALLSRLTVWLQDGVDFSAGGEYFAEAVIRAVVAHVYLEWIHPFGDGNGRTGRLLEFYILLRAGNPDIACHVLSNFYNRTRPAYYRHLDRARREQSLTAFIDYAAEGFRDGLMETLAAVQQSQFQIAWRSLVHDRFAGLRHRKTTVLKRRRELMLAIPLDHRLTAEEIVLNDPRTAKAYGALSERTLRRDLALLVETELLVKSGEGFAANIELLRARMARRAPVTPSLPFVVDVARADVRP